MSRRNVSLIPRTTDASATTTNAPMATPMIVRPALAWFTRNAPNAMPMLSSAWRTLITEPITVSSRALRGIRRSSSLLLPQCLDEIQPRRTTGGIDTRDDADRAAEHRRHDDRPRCDRSRQWRVRLDQLRTCEAQQAADDGAHRADGRR